MRCYSLIWFIFCLLPISASADFEMHTKINAKGDEDLAIPVRLFLEGRYQELVDNYSARDLSDQITRIDSLCSAQLILGEYSDFFKCTRTWGDASIALTAGAYWYQPNEGIELSQQKDKYYGKHYDKQGNLLVAETEHTSVMTQEEANARRNRLLAEAWFQLGDYEKAGKYALTAIQQYQPELATWVGPTSRPDLVFLTPFGGPWWGTATNEEAFPGGRKDFTWTFDILVSASLAAQSQIRLGKPEKAQAMIDIIESVHVDSDGDDLIPSFSRMRDTLKNTIYFASGDYAQLEVSEKGWDEYLDDAQGFGLMSIGAGLSLMAAINGSGDPTASLDLVEMGWDVVQQDQADGIIMREAFQNARIMIIKQKWKEALSYIDTILSHEKIVNFSELKQLSLQQKGLILVQFKRPDEALTAFEASIELIEQSRGNVSTEAQKLGYFSDKNLPYQESIKLLLARGDAVSAFAMAERSRARVLVDMLADSQNRRGQLPKSLVAIVPPKPVDNVVSKETTSSNTSGDTANNNPIIQTFDQSITKEPVTLTTRGLRRSTASQRRAIEAETLTSVQAYTAKDLQQLLSPGELVVEYVELDNQWVAFKVSAELVEAVDLKLEDLTTRIEQYRRALQDPNSDQYRQEAQALYRDLVAPLKLTDTQALTIIPSGVLNYLPFSTLHDGEQYFIQQRILKLIPSVTSKAFLLSKKATPRLLAMGNPTGDLPGAEAEVIALGQTFKDSKVVKRELATETLLKERGGDFNILHIASHGVFASSDPSASRLLLSADASNDGDLTMSEIYGLELDANLVVLSACNTGLSEIKNGEEIFGLTRGFLYAGSSNIVASLWKVNDIATQALMTDFYRRLNHNGYAEALRGAQLSLQKGKFSHPYYWAAFQLTGDG